MNMQQIYYLDACLSFLVQNILSVSVCMLFITEVVHQHNDTHSPGTDVELSIEMLCK